MILCFVILLQPIALKNIMGQYTTTKRGIMVNAGGQQVELAVAKAAVFRISICFSGVPAAIPSIFIDNSDTTYSDFTIVTDAPSYGIQTSFGRLMINSETKKWSLYDESGNVLIPAGTFSISSAVQGFNDGPKSSGTFYGSGNKATKNLIKSNSISSMDNGVVDVPYLWNTLGYSALGISQDDDNPAQWYSVDSSVAGWSFKGTSSDLYVWPAKTLYDAMKGLIKLTGKPKVPPKWAFGYLQSRWGWENRNYIENALDSFRILKLPVDAFIYDFEWYTVTPDYSIGSSGTANFSDFGFNQNLFPDPALQITTYKSKGVRFVGIRKPRLGNTANLDFARSNGWLENAGIGDRDLNFRIEGLRQWYGAQTKPLLDAGVDALWDDEGESYYSCYYWWNKAESDLRDSVLPNNRHFTINRAFSPGNQRMGYCTWNGDIESTWDALLSTPADLLNWSLSGMYYGTCDIGGFQGTPSTENLVRWFQAAVFFPVMRAHSIISSVPRFPWLWGKDAEAAIRKALNLRYQLIPYIYSLGHEAYNTGAPIMRPLIMEFQNDPNVANMTDEWLLGKGLLAAPIMNQGGTRSVYLPKGVWYDFQTNQIYNGPLTFFASKMINQIPVYVREGTILPIGPIIQYTGQDTIAPLEIHIYPGSDATFTLTEDDGKSYNYIKDSVRTTTYNWTDATNTLSWLVNGAYKDKAVFTTIKGVFGDQEQTASLGTQGNMVFSTFQNIQSVHDINENKIISINLYPIPASDMVFVDLTNLGIFNVQITISDIQGNIVYNKKTEGGELYKLSVSNLQNGLYLLNIRNDKINLNKKLVIAR